MNRRLRYVLWAYTVLMGVLGLAFFLFPKESAALWPWMLPPLAARFMGSLFLGGAVCGAVNLRRGESAGLMVLVLIAVGDILIALAGLLGMLDTGMTLGVVLWLIFFVGVALLLTVTVLPVARNAVSDGIAQPRALKIFFRIHLIVVLPVGISMLFFPTFAKQLWPWTMSDVNVRMLGSFFFGAAFISIWCLRQPTWDAVVPALALYATFATLATIASLIHFSLFNPARIVTWAFFGLYVFVAAGSWWFWLRFPRAQGSGLMNAATSST